MTNAQRKANRSGKCMAELAILAIVCRIHLARRDDAAANRKNHLIMTLRINFSDKG